MGAATQPGVPNLDSPMVNQDGSPSIPWYAFFIALWGKAGGSTPITGTVVFSFANSILSAFTAVPTLIGALIYGNAQSDGTIRLRSRISGGAPIPQSPVASPFTFDANSQGVLVIQNGQVELSRDSGTWYVTGLTGGVIPMLAGDSVRVTWYGADAPLVTFFPWSL